jgi:hypothetical protein
MTATHNVTYMGGSVASWLQQRALMIISNNPEVEQPLIARFDLKKPTEFLVQGHQVNLRALSIRFHPRVQWLSQIVTLDAKNGIYDYVRGRVRLAAGSNSYVIEGVNFDTAKPMASPPPVSGIGVGLHPGEVDITLLMIEGLDLPQGTQIPKLEELVKPDDLSMTITGSQLRGANLDRNWALHSVGCPFYFPQPSGQAPHSCPSSLAACRDTGSHRPEA